MVRVAWIACFVVLAGSVAAVCAEEQARPAPPPDDAAYSASQACIGWRDVRRIEVLDQYHLLFRAWGGKYFLNTTPKACPFMTSKRTISVNSSRHRQVCRGDTVKALERGASVYENTMAEPEELVGFSIVGECTLGAFEQISKDQLDVLELEFGVSRPSRPSGPPGK